MLASEWPVGGIACGAPGPAYAVDECLREGATAPCFQCTPRAQGADAVSRLFGTRVINDGAGMIKLDVPHVVTREADLPVSVQVNWPLVLTKAVARLYLIADCNPNALLASLSLIPDLVPPHVCMNVRLDDSTDIHAVVECGDGTLLQVRRWVQVTPPGLDATECGSANPERE